jgi:Ger(x)C family germination protein
MKRLFLTLPLIILVAFLSSCGGNVPLEDLTISLILGIDLDDENNLIISESSPVFNKESKRNTETYEVKAKSIRESRKYFDVKATGEVTAAKIQILLIGKRVLEHEGWFSLLDTVYRNPTFALNTRVIVVDGPVSDVIYYEPDNKPQLPLYLKEVIDKNSDRTQTVMTTLQVLHRQMYEKGMTPSISEIKKAKDLELVGVSLLNKKGKIVDTLNIQETALLIVLQDQKKKELTYSLEIPALDDEKGIFNTKEVSLDVRRVHSTVKTKYAQGKFHFHYKINLGVNIVERLFPKDSVKDEELEKMIEKELKSKFEEVIKKVQDHKIDPIGLGIYARAYEYEHYKKVQDDWGRALSGANIDMDLNIEIKSMGATK